MTLPSGRIFPTYGNALLLDYPEKEIVRFSRSFREEEWARRQEEVMRIAVNGGVLVSPFIHPYERALRDQILEAGGRIIHVVDRRFAPREKPARREFELCAQGKALIISRTDAVRTDDVMTRELAMSLNRMAEWIVVTPTLSRYHSAR